MVEKNVSVDDIVTTLTRYNLLGLLPAITTKVIQMSSQKNKNEIISIESPFMLSEDAIIHIKKIIGSDISHEITINKNILAGFKARHKGKLYDGSAERIIRQFTK